MGTMYREGVFDEYSKEGIRSRVQDRGGKTAGRGEKAFPSHGRRTPGTETDEVARLRKESAGVKKENEILKKAAAFFAREFK